MWLFNIALWLNRNNYAVKHELLTRAVQELFNTVSADDILKQTPDGLTFEGKTLMPELIPTIREEAKMFRDSRLWDILEKDIQYQANLAMFTHSKSEHDLVAGKMLLYVLDVIRTRLKKL